MLHVWAGRLDSLAAVTGNALSEKTVIGRGHNYSVMVARLTLKSINDELVRRGRNARLEIMGPK